MMKLTNSAILAIAMCIVAGPAAAAESKTLQSEKHAFRIVTLVQGLKYPWSLAFLPDGRVLVTERAGRLRIVSREFKLDPKPVEGAPRKRLNIRDLAAEKRPHREGAGPSFGPGEQRGVVEGGRVRKPSPRFVPAGQRHAVTGIGR